MAQTIVQRIKGILSSRSDDYFHPDDLLDYANEGYKSVVSKAVKEEIGQSTFAVRSIRALDKLRNSQIFSTFTFDVFRSFFISELNLTDLDIEAITYVSGNFESSGIHFSEIVSSRKKELNWGLLFPTSQQGYYEFFKNEAEKKLRVYLAEEYEDFEIQMDYFSKPSDLTADSTTLPDIPDRLIHAVVLKAALLGGVQEIRENAESYKTLFDEEVRDHLW